MAESQIKHYPIERVRNIGIIAHIDAGKTTTTERVLYYTGKTYKIGDIDEGTTQMDWMEQEKERGITITAAATTTFWEVKKDPLPNFAGSFRINLIDTPGHVDFTAEVERSLRVLDGGIVVFDGVAGVEPQSETVWRQADKYKVPRLCFINKLDRMGANFEKDVLSIRERLGAKIAVMQIPVGLEEKHKGVIDLLSGQAIIWKDETLGAEFEYQDIPAELKEAAQKARGELIELIAESDDELLEKYLAGQELSLNELKLALRQATVRNEIFPVFCGSALKNKGVQLLLDAVINFLPSPGDLPPVTGLNPKTGEHEKREAKENEPLSALAFKVQTDPYVGRLVYTRVYSGKLLAGSYTYNSTKAQKERVGRLLLMHANHREETKELTAGEIGAVVGLKETITGDTLSDEQKPIILEQIEFPEPVISLAIEPKTKIDQEKMSQALHRLSEEDPTFKMKGDPETGQTIISGMGELHLEIIVDRMRREFSVEANVGAPQVAYKETITRLIEDIEGKYIRQSGGRGQYGHVVINLEPLPRGSGREFINKIKGGSIPNEFIPAIQKGVLQAQDGGILAGFPLTDLRVVLHDGSYHEVDSSELAFKIAGEIAIKEGTKKAGLVLLEPIMRVEVVTPEGFLGDVIGDLSSKRGQIGETQMRGNARAVSALVPLSEMFGYATTLRSITQGRASFTMEPSHYQEVPQNITEKIIGKGK